MNKKHIKLLVMTLFIGVFTSACSSDKRVENAKSMHPLKEGGQVFCYGVRRNSVLSRNYSIVTIDGAKKVLIHLDEDTSFVFNAPYCKMVEVETK